MQFTISAATLVALASAVLAQTANFDPITSPTKGETVNAGSTFDIVWQPSTKYTGTVTLSLLGGSAPDKLQTVETIKSGVSNSAGKYSWAVESTLGKDATYGIQITLDSDKTVFQYSFPFVIKGSASGGSSSSSSYSTSGTASTGSHSATTMSTYTATTTPSSNLSTTASAGPTKVTLTTTAAGTGGSGSSPTKTGSTVPSSGAQSLVAGSLAMLGAIAMAAFAL